MQFVFQMTVYQQNLKKKGKAFIELIYWERAKSIFFIYFITKISGFDDAEGGGKVRWIGLLGFYFLFLISGIKLKKLKHLVFTFSISAVLNTSVCIFSQSAVTQSMAVCSHNLRQGQLPITFA